MAFTPGKGTQLQLSIASVYTAIAQVVGITPPSMDMGTTETTHLLSTWREFIGTIPDGGEIQFTVEYDAANATHAAIWAKFVVGAIELWKVVFTDLGNAEVGFSGIITGFHFDEVVIDNVATVQITVKISGAVTITP